MKIPKFLIVAGFALVLCFSTQAQPGSSPDAREKFVADLIAKMTLEEKVGQMTQISLEVFAKGFPAVKEPLELNLDALRNGIVKQHVGSILNVGTSAHPVDRWNQFIKTIQDVALKETRLKIPILYGIDAVHGASYVKDATLFPQSIAMAATWNPELMRQSAEITAVEIRAAGLPWNFNPVLDMGRQPLWPRFWETFGEDPYLASVMGAAYVHGLQGDPANLNATDKAAACLKHYIGYSFPLSGKDRTPAWIPERMLREIFVPGFKAAIDAGAASVMVNSSEINGEPVHGSYFYLTELLRNQLGFQGMIVTDWEDIINLYRREKIATDNRDAVRQAVLAGIDMSMVPHDYSFGQALIELVKEGAVPISRVDDAVSRILKLKYDLGLFTNPYPNPKLKARFATKESQALNLRAAQEGLTLLKNDNNALPLKKGIKILITGPTANKLSYLNGGWTITWQGDREDLYPQEKLTILEALQQKLGAANVRYQPGTEVTKALDIAAAVAEAQHVDAIVACLGEAPYCETPGNIDDLTLPEPQLRLIEELAQANKPLILVLVEGRPRLITQIVDQVDALVLAYLPGIEGGPAVADVLFGDANPSGKLPFTYPRFVNNLVPYDHKNSEAMGFKPLFRFGDGLSYTTFKYEKLELDRTQIKQGESITVRVTVSNTGLLKGKEVVQLYLSDLVASITPPVKRLKRFEKIELAPGESRLVSFTLATSDLSFIGLDQKPTVEPGGFRVSIGSLNKEFSLH